MKSIIYTAVAASLTFCSLQTNAHNHNVTASVSAANFYLWRGLDLGDGEPQVAGSLTLASQGAYAGVGGASGDATNGSEIDLYVGYGSTMGDFNYDLSYWSYVYPESKIDFGEAAEGVLALGYGPVTYKYYHNLSKDAKDREWNYMSVGLQYQKFSALLGKHHYQSYVNSANNTKVVKGMYHADVSYQYNKNLTFTISQPFKANDNVNVGNTKFHVNLALPLKL